MTRHPLVIAHRTCPLDAADNSLDGIVTAARLGADVVEVDVRLTRDAVAVLMHDPTPWRTTRRPIPVRLATARALSRRRLLANGEPVPTFTAALEVLPGDLRVAVDVKAPKAMAAAIEALRRARRLDDALLWCRSADSLLLAHGLAPGVPSALLRNTRDEASSLRYLDDAARLGTTAVSLHERAVTAAIVDAAHARGLTAYAWALAESSHERLLAAGVDGLVTDWPRSARERIDRDG